MKINELLKTIETSYKNQFPNSIIKAKINKGLGNNIYIKCLLVGSKEELSGGYIENDMFSIVFWSSRLDNNITEESEVPTNLILECTEKNYTIKPDSQYMAYGRRKLNYRKSTGSEKIIKSLDNFFIKLKVQLEKDLQENNIHDNFKELLASKL